MEQTVYKYCAVIGMDGMGNFNREAQTPRMDAIFQGGAVTYDALSMDPTISAENWGAMLLGMTPTVHGLTNSYISRYENTNPKLVTVFRRLHDVYPDAYYASVSNWNPINHGIVEHDIGVDLATADNDELLLPEIVKRVAKKPKFLFVQFDNIDGAGHHYGYGTPDHLACITRNDGLVGQVYDAYRDAGILDETLFLVIADHGGNGHGHGGYTDGEKYVFFGAAGKSVKPGTVGTMATVDIAAIVLYALGAPLPAYDKKGFSSQVPENLFTDCTLPYRVTVAAPSRVTTKPTPAIDGEGGLYRFFPASDVKTALFFDDDLCDATGHCAYRAVNEPKFYTNGVYGSCGEFGTTGYAETADLRVGAGSFTLGVWLQASAAVNTDCLICATKDWPRRSDKGFALVQRPHNLRFLIASGDDCDDCVAPWPDEISGGWLHALVSVDREEKTMSIYFDFERVGTWKLDDQYCGDIDTDAFVVGNDAGDRSANTTLYPNLFRMDDLLVFGRAFTDADAAKLKAYYGV